MATAQWKIWPTFFHSDSLGRRRGGSGGGGRARPGAMRTATAPISSSLGQLLGRMGEGVRPSDANQTSNKTSQGSLVSCPRLPRFARFPFSSLSAGKREAPPPWIRVRVLGGAAAAASAKRALQQCAKHVLKSSGKHFLNSLERALALLFIGQPWHARPRGSGSCLRWISIDLAGSWFARREQARRNCA